MYYLARRSSAAQHLLTWGGGGGWVEVAVEGRGLGGELQQPQLQAAVGGRQVRGDGNHGHLRV